MIVKTTDAKAVLLMLSVCATISTCSLRALAGGGTRGALRAFPVHVTDRDEPGESREARLERVAEAIDSATEDPLERAALLTLARYESGLARYVQEGRCADGPRGSRECDSGRSVGLFQLRPNANHPEVPESLGGQAAMALRLWRGARVRCRSSVPDELAGAFSAYGTGGGCGASWAKGRAEHLRRLRARL